MPIEKDILKTAIAQLRKELRGVKGPVVVTVEAGHQPDEEETPDDPDAAEEGAEMDGKPDPIKDALAALRKK